MKKILILKKNRFQGEGLEVTDQQDVVNLRS